jgi:hypothetical protein
LTHKVVEELTLLVATKLIVGPFPFVEAEVTEFSKFALGASHSVTFQLVLRDGMLAVWTFLGIFLDPVESQPIFELNHF